MSSLYTVDYPVSLELLLYPSFALPLFDVSRGYAVKRYGHCSGLSIRMLDGGYQVSHGDPQCIDYARFILGLWFNPRLYMELVSDRFKLVVRALLDAYPGFSLSVSPMDDVIVFTSIVLSRITDYHVNTVRWVRALLDAHGDITGIARVGVGEISSRISGSFLVRSLPEILACYLSVGSEILGNPSRVWRLLECNGVGPKVLYSYMLHVLMDTSYAPVDVNLELFLDNMGLRRSRLRPDKRFCLKYNCSNCPVSDTCIEAWLRKELGLLTGWFQTIAYTHTKRYCRRRACNRCTLRGLCIRSSR